jgi:protein phosphatase methylesterase 1
MAASGFTPWNKCWDRKFSVTVPGRGEFNAYGVDGPSDYFTVAIHGAGHSALSFSLFAAQLKGTIPVVALDLKCHGDTPGDESTDLTMENLIADVAGFCQVVQPPKTHLVLVGHSLGGSIASFVAHRLHVSVLVVIDTIEGTAVESMPRMKEVLSERPEGFLSPDDAIEYIAMAGELQNYESAAISAAGRLKAVDGGFIWKTDFMKCEKDWMSWFVGFADAYLTAEGYKVLVLPDINRLDTPFTIGHMSGKFQLCVVLDTNHCVHEDKPKEVAQMLIKLVKRIGPTHQWD